MEGGNSLQIIMTLPRLDLPTYQVDIPVSKLQFRVRPYTTREEKVLLLLKESTLESQTASNMCQIVDACSINIPKPAKDLPFADMIWTFLKIRSYSVGEISELNYRCLNLVADKPCNAPISYQLNLNDIPVVNNTGIRDIDLGSGVSLRLRYHTAADVIDGNVGDTVEDLEIASLYNMVDSIFTQTEVNERADIPFDEFKEWYLNIPLSKKSEIEAVLKTEMPALKVGITLTCPKCKNVSRLTLESVSDFFP